MGAGNKIDPTLFEVADIYQTSVCPLAKVMRRELKKRGINAIALGHYFETYCRDFFLDQMSAFDCAASFAEDRVAKERLAIAEAKRIMREHGYRVRTLKG